MKALFSFTLLLHASPFNAFFFESRFSRFQVSTRSGSRSNSRAGSEDESSPADVVAAAKRRGTRAKRAPPVASSSGADSGETQSSQLSETNLSSQQSERNVEMVDAPAPAVPVVEVSQTAETTPSRARRAGRPKAAPKTVPALTPVKEAVVPATAATEAVTTIKPAVMEQPKETKVVEFGSALIVIEQTPNLQIKQKLQPPKEIHGKPISGAVWQTPKQKYFRFIFPLHF